MSSPSFIEFGQPPFPGSDTLSLSWPLNALPDPLAPAGAQQVAGPAQNLPQELEPIAEPAAAPAATVEVTLFLFLLRFL